MKILHTQGKILFLIIYCKNIYNNIIRLTKKLVTKAKR